MAIVGINPTQGPERRRDRQDPLDRELGRVLSALQIAKMGFGIATEFSEKDAADAQTELAELKAVQQAQINRQSEIDTALAEQGFRTAPTDEEIKQNRSIEVQGQQAEVSRVAGQAAKLEAETERVKTQTQMLEKEMNALQASGRGITDFGKPMDSTQLKSQSFLDRSIKATDRMKAISPKVSPELMSRQIKALREAGSIPVVGGAADFVATVLGEDAMQMLPESDRIYLLNAAELSNAILRDETGAQANAQELALRMQQFVPAPGNTNADLEAKGKLIEDALDGLRTKTGKFKQPLTNDEDLKFNYMRIKARDSSRANERVRKATRALKGRESRQGGGLLDAATQFIQDSTGVAIPPENKKQVPQQRNRRRGLPFGKRG